MIDLKPPCRPGQPDDASSLAELVNMAGEGLPLYVWSTLAEPGESPWDVGHKRALRDSGGFSYRNAVVREEKGKVIACLIGYPLEEDPTPVNYQELPSMFAPLQELEDKVPGTWYVNVLATYPEYRNKGYGLQFLAIAEQLAKHSHKNGLSVIVSDVNIGARRLYEKCGYREYARRKMIKEDWINEGENWILLTRDI